MEEPHTNTEADLVRKKAEKLVSEAPRRWMEATVTILVTVALFAFIGKKLDSYMGTTPWLFIIGIVISFPLSQYLIYRQLKKRFKF
jgi:F0F1-type ATP synthase assembly protein I